MNKAKIWFSTNKILLLGAVVLGTAWLFLYSVALSAGQGPWHHNQVIRLHILAHDNSPEEQELKLAVRDEVWEFVDNLVKSAGNVDEARQIITENLPAITEAAQQTVNGHSVAVKFLDNLHFPATSYAGIIFPQGRYTALQIIIGEGGGGNWWCVMFPPMCLMELTQAQVNELSEEQLEQLTIRPRFKIAEVFQNIFN